MIMAAKNLDTSTLRSEYEVEDFSISENEIENMESENSATTTAANKPSTNSLEPQNKITKSPSPTAAKENPDKQGFIRLVNFIKAHIKEKNNPELIKKSKAISAYKKVKDAA